MMRQVIVEGLRPRGEVHLTLVRGDITPAEQRAIIEGRFDRGLGRRIQDRIIVRNLVTNTGRADFVTRIAGSASTVPTHLAVGTTAITPAVTDTTLSGELMRKALTTSAAFQTYYIRYAVTFTTTDFNNTILGMALFSAAAAGDMFAIVSTSVTKDGTQSLVADWRIQLLSS